jgi:hypothetical protein
LLIAVENPFPEFARSKIIVPELLFCGLTLETVALSEERTPCPTIAPRESTIAIPAKERHRKRLVVIFIFISFTP